MVLCLASAAASAAGAGAGAGGGAGAGAGGGGRVRDASPSSCTTAAPPDLVTARCPVPAVSSALLCDQHNLLFALHSDFLALTEHAR